MTTSTGSPSVDDLAWVVDAAGPGHLADVDEAFDAVFETDERTVTHDVDDLALHAAANGVLGLDRFPRAVLTLLEAKGDLFLVPVDVEDLDLDLLIDLDDLARDG